MNKFFPAAPPCSTSPDINGLTWQLRSGRRPGQDWPVPWKINRQPSRLGRQALSPATTCGPHCENCPSALPVHATAVSAVPHRLPRHPGTWPEAGKKIRPANQSPLGILAETGRRASRRCRSAEGNLYLRVFSQSARNFSMPTSVSGCLASCCITAKGMVQMSAPIKAALSTCMGLRTEATMISVA